MSSKTKTERLIAGLNLIKTRVRDVSFRHISGLAMFKVEPALTDEEILQLEELGWSAGANSAGFPEGGNWQ